MDPDTIAEQVRMCAACPKMCRHVCPTFLAWRSDSPTPHGRALLIHQENMSVRDLDDRAIEVLYQCLECSNCLTWCLPEVDIAEIVDHKRRELVTEGRYPPKLDALRDKIRETNNPFGEEPSTRTDWLPEVPTDGIKIIYFTGCTAAYREQSIAKDAVEVLSQLGYSVIVNEDEKCCGSPLFRTGFVEDARTIAEPNVQFLNETEGEMIVVTCPGCYRVLTRDYPENDFELDKPVLHMSELLVKMLKHLKPVADLGKMTYHDPCHLGRHLGIYEEPREVLNHISGNNLIEMERTGDDALCCGNGAGLRTLFGEHAHIIGKERVKQAERTKAEYLITACPFCKNMLSSESDGTIEVLDLPEIVLKALKKND